MNLVDLAVAFGAGIISITSPCCLPLLPGYVGYLTGMPTDSMGVNRMRTLAASTLFVIGFGVIFVALGATASEIGSLLFSYRLPVARVAGLFIVVMGLVLVLERHVGLLSHGGDWSRWFGGGRLWTAPLLGAAFAITWTPCIGPVLGAILTLAGSTADLTKGVLLLAAYSLGLGLPFIGLGFSVHRVRAWLRRVGRGAALIHGLSGLLLVAMGILLITDRWLPLISPVLGWYAQMRWPPV